MRYRAALYSEDKIVMVGLEGFEPSHDAVKVRCLTAWRQPIALIDENMVELIGIEPMTSTVQV